MQVRLLKERSSWAVELFNLGQVPEFLFLYFIPLSVSESPPLRIEGVL